MIRPSFLMCPPDYFDVVYEINPWMRVDRKVNRAQAAKQWEALYRLLTGKLRVQVELLTPVRGLPDLVFTANAGLVHRRVFVKSHFRYRQRQAEEPVYEHWFKKAGYIVKSIPKPLHFEGEGDALWMGKELYAGYHYRSDIHAHEALVAHLKTPYFALQLCDKRFYHLDTCFFPVDEKTAVIYFKAFDPYAQMILHENVADPVKVPEQEALCFACNGIAVGHDVVIPAGCPTVAKELEKRKFRVHELDFSEFIKAGGAAKCLVLKI